MSYDWVVHVEELTAEAFVPFGRILSIPATPATSSGPGWQCWYHVQTLECPWPLVMGAVATRYRPIVVSEMERHVHTFELLLAHGHPLIQPVALPGAPDDASARPNPGTARAFRIPAGAGIIMHPGTWHSSAFPEREDTTYSFACMEPSFAGEAVWVPFANSDLIRVTNT